jgi:hypothetical protein
MEIFLNLWDELDDLAGACRHIATATAAELAGVARPLAALVIGSAASFWSAVWGFIPSLKNLI